MQRDPVATTVIVFSHPNHELAIFGILQALRPHLVYLTDGGGEARVAETRRGLASVGLGDRARFLDYTEASFYRALLERDAGFYEGVAARLREVLTELRPAQVLCDAVEFYNPVHDMALPIVRAALRELPGTPVFEVPLVYQQPGEGERFQVQRPPARRRGDQEEWPLATGQLDAKIAARDRIYTILRDQMGPVITDLSPADLALEVVTPAPASLPAPDADRVLRYERRAQLLLERGDIERPITYAGHYLPVATALL